MGKSYEYQVHLFPVICKHRSSTPKVACIPIQIGMIQLFINVRWCQRKVFHRDENGSLFTLRTFLTSKVDFFAHILRVSDLSRFSSVQLLRPITSTSFLMSYSFSFTDVYHSSTANFINRENLNHHRLHSPAASSPIATSILTIPLNSSFNSSHHSPTSISSISSQHADSPASSTSPISSAVPSSTWKPLVRAFPAKQGEWPATDVWILCHIACSTIMAPESLLTQVLAQASRWCN